MILSSSSDKLLEAVEQLFKKLDKINSNPDTVIQLLTH